MNIFTGSIKPMTFTVYGYEGQPIGSASDFADAKKIQEADIKEHAPQMLASYEGVSTSADSFGMPVFAKAVNH